jgi:Domain of unknown function (DUF4397)
MKRVSWLMAAGGLALGPFLAGGAVAQDMPTQLYAVHAINGLDLGLPEEDAAVDILVSPEEGEETCTADVVFKTVLGPIEVPAGNYVITVSVADENAPCEGALVGSTEVSVTGFEPATLVVAGLDVGAAPIVRKFPVNANPLPEGSSRVSVVHVAVAPQIDIAVRNAETGAPEAFFKVENPNSSYPLVLDSGRYRVAVRVADPADPDQLERIARKTLTVEPGVAAVAVVAGSLENGATIIPVPIDTAAEDSTNGGGS